MRELPLDREGRVLPPPAWPPERNAPGALELLRRFCNTTNRENGADRLREARDLDAWLTSEGERPVAASGPELARLRTFRERLFDVLVDAHGPPATETGAPRPAADRVSRLAASLSTVRARVIVSGGSLQLTGAGRSDADNLLARLAVILLQAQASDQWLRLTPCRDCRWVVYDGLKNRSVRWCSMSACGGRHNARAYRRRARQRV